jgi:hypothetical protein
MQEVGMSALVDEEENGSIRYLGQLVFPDYVSKMIRVLEKMKPGKGLGLLSEDYFHCVAEEFYPNHVKEVIKIMMEHRIYFFCGHLVDRIEQELEARRIVYAKFDELGIPCIW